jgi:hypothetical protein
MSMYKLEIIIKYVCMCVCMCKIEPGYNDIGFYATSSMESDIFITNEFLIDTITLHSSAKITLSYSDTKCSVSFMT